MIIVRSEPVTLVGGALFSPDVLRQALSLAPVVVAADGGADQALRFGVMPEAVIGDFDSIGADAVAKIPKQNLHHIAEQDSTDFDKCLRNISAPLIIGVGFTGARLDHQLAACNALVRHPQQICILVGEDDLIFLVPPGFSLDLAPGTVVSLFPMGAVEGVSDGLRWPVSGLNFAPDRQIGTSNEATGPIHLNMTAPKMLMILPAYELKNVVQALGEAPSGWPAI